MKLYRAMCDKEFHDMQKFNSLSWNSKFKWFGTKEFVIKRVLDGKFNNSKFVSERYKNLIEIDFSEESEKHFRQCGNDEFMLERKKVPLVKILNWELVNE